MPKVIVIDTQAVSTKCFRISPFPKYYGNKEILREVRKYVKGLGKSPEFAREKNSLCIISEDGVKRVELRFQDFT